jgi:hypothetical protein
MIFVSRQVTRTANFLFPQVTVWETRLGPTVANPPPIGAKIINDQDSMSAEQSPNEFHNREDRHDHDQAGQLMLCYASVVGTAGEIGGRWFSHWRLRGFPFDTTVGALQMPRATRRVRIASIRHLRCQNTDRCRILHCYYTNSEPL